MENHNIPNDNYNHIESFACGCNPIVVVSEGEESYIHNQVRDKFEHTTINLVNPLKKCKITYVGKYGEILSELFPYYNRCIERSNVFGHGSKENKY
jgi:hypothetical protein